MDSVKTELANRIVKAAEDVAVLNRHVSKLEEELAAASAARDNRYYELNMAMAELVNHCHKG